MFCAFGLNLIQYVRESCFAMICPSNMWSLPADCNLQIGILTNQNLSPFPVFQAQKCHLKLKFLWRELFKVFRPIRPKFCKGLFDLKCGVVITTCSSCIAILDFEGTAKLLIKVMMKNHCIDVMHTITIYSETHIDKRNLHMTLAFDK